MVTSDDSWTVGVVEGVDRCQVRFVQCDESAALDGLMRSKACATSGGGRRLFHCPLRHDSQGAFKPATGELHIWLTRRHGESAKRPGGGQASWGMVVAQSGCGWSGKVWCVRINIAMQLVSR